MSTQAIRLAGISGELGAGWRRARGDERRARIIEHVFCGDTESKGRGFLEWVMLGGRGRVWAALFPHGAQDPGRGQHYPLEPVARLAFPPASINHT